MPHELPGETGSTVADMDDLSQQAKNDLPQRADVVFVGR